MKEQADYVAGCQTCDCLSRTIFAFMVEESSVSPMRKTKGCCLLDFSRKTVGFSVFA